MKKPTVAVLISGSGTNLQALIDACADDTFPARIGLVLSNKAEAYGLKRAEAAGIPTHVISHKDYASREAFDDAMNAILSAHGVDLICLAGFMRLLTPAFVNFWHDRMLNIHPSLLPAFKGLHTHERALSEGVSVTGCTVHFVRAEMDVGPIIIQAEVPVLAGDTPEILGKRVLTAEHRCYPLALQLLAEGKLTVVDEKVNIAGYPAGEAIRISLS